MRNDNIVRAHKQQARSNKQRNMSHISTFEEVKHWLESIKPTYERFAPAFDEYGCEDIDDVKAMLDQDTLESGLMDKLREHGTKPLHEKRIKEAISRLHNQSREADAQAQSHAQVEVEIHTHETQQADDMINLVEPQQEQLNETRIRERNRTDAKNLISNLCEKKRKLITLEEIYERVGAQTELEKNGVRYGVWESKDALKIRSTSQRGIYEVC